MPPDARWPWWLGQLGRLLTRRQAYRLGVGRRHVKIWDARTTKCLQTLEGHDASVRSVAFSHDDKHIASASDDHTVKIWDARTGECLQTFTIGKTLDDISFDPTGSYLQTEIGAIVLDESLALNTAQNKTVHLKPSYQGYGVSSDGLWITWNSDNLLWLPSEYRPSSSAVAASTVAIGCRAGRVLIFNLVPLSEGPGRT